MCHLKDNSINYNIPKTVSVSPSSSFSNIEDKIGRNTLFSDNFSTQKSVWLPQNWSYLHKSGTNWNLFASCLQKNNNINHMELFLMSELIEYSLKMAFFANFRQTSKFQRITWTLKIVGKTSKTCHLKDIFILNSISKTVWVYNPSSQLDIRNKFGKDDLFSGNLITLKSV